jgi:casein kinase I family protein HRR25
MQSAVQKRSSKTGHIEFPVVRVSGRYRVGKLLGSGTFGKCSLKVLPVLLTEPMIGSVYLGKDVRTGREVALKVERHQGSDSDLFHEFKIYKDINGCPGIPKAYWYGTEGPYNVMVMNRYELSLDEMVSQGPLDLLTVVSFADQMVSQYPKIHETWFNTSDQLRTLECLHARDYIHRDIKPDNFMIGFDSGIYLIDFGLAQYFRNPTSHIHIPQTRGHNLVGTIRYTSINSHMGIQQSRRDDLESLAYTFVFLLCGKLPWQGIPSVQNTDRGHVVLRQKQEISKKPCNTIPTALTTFLQYTQSLAFEEEPDYVHLHGLIHKLPT